MVQAIEILGQRCVLGELLGEGGMGRVFRSEHPLGFPLAVKLLGPRCRGERGMERRLLREAHAAARVGHPAVVRVIDYGRNRDGEPFVAMLRIEGEPLGVAIHRQGPLSITHLRGVAIQILLGLGAIHRARLVHADIKSDNVLVEAALPEPRATIIDFGLACTPSAEAIDELSGTPDYMAPEVISGARPTRASDLYAIGVILYEMLTGTTPFVGATTEMVFDGHLHEALVPPSLRCPDRAIPPSLERLVMRALSKDPVHRPHDAELFATAIDRAAVPMRGDKWRRAPAAFSTTATTRDWAITPRGSREPLEDDVIRPRRLG
jgi:eukaryotic-like serine/threonine-protein kinase